jgi:hypothetical protein
MVPPAVNVWMTEGVVFNRVAPEGPPAMLPIVYVPGALFEYASGTDEPEIEDGPVRAKPTAPVHGEPSRVALTAIVPVLSELLLKLSVMVWLVPLIKPCMDEGVMSTKVAPGGPPEIYRALYNPPCPVASVDGSVIVKEPGSILAKV